MKAPAGLTDAEVAELFARTPLMNRLERACAVSRTEWKNAFGSTTMSTALGAAGLVFIAYWLWPSLGQSAPGRGCVCR